MADTKITGLTELAATPASNDWYVVADVSDTTMNASGTNKKLSATRVVHKDTSGNVAVIGNFSVGTATAGAIAHIYSPSDESLRIAGTAATSNPYISFYQGTTRRSYVQHVDTNDTLNLVSEYGNVSIKAAATLGSDSEAEYITVKAGGNVGIGQTSPSFKLDVNGSFQSTSIGSTWTSLSLGSGWANYGSGYQDAQYKKVGDLVFLRGHVKRTSGSSSTIATLPSGHRPASYTQVVVSSSGTYGQIDIANTGDMYLITGNVSLVSLNGIIISTL